MIGRATTKAFTFLLFIVLLSSFSLAQNNWLRLGGISCGPEDVCNYMSDCNNYFSRSNNNPSRYPICEVEEGALETVYADIISDPGTWQQGCGPTATLIESYTDGSADWQFPIVMQDNKVVGIKNTRLMGPRLRSACGFFKILNTVPIKHQCYAIDTANCGDITDAQSITLSSDAGSMSFYDLSAYSLFHAINAVRATNEITLGSNINNPAVSMTPALSEFPETYVIGSLNIHKSDDSAKLTVEGGDMLVSNNIKAGFFNSSGLNLNKTCDERSNIVRGDSTGVALTFGSSTVRCVVGDFCEVDADCPIGARYGCDAGICIDCGSGFEYDYDKGSCEEPIVAG